MTTDLAGMAAVEGTVPCPCCNAPMPAEMHPEAVLALVTVGTQRLILKELIKSMPRYVTKERLVNLIYGYRDVDDPENLIEGAICKLRKRIKGSSYQITSPRFVGYRLERRQS